MDPHMFDGIDVLMKWGIVGILLTCILGVLGATWLVWFAVHHVYFY